MALNTERIEQFAKRKRLAELFQKKANEINKELQAEEQILIDHMLENGVTKLSLKGGVTIRTNENIWAKCIKVDGTDRVDRKKVIQALKEAGLDFLVEEATFNSNRLSAFLRELDENNEELPESFKGIIEPVSKVKLIAQKY